MYFMMFTVNSYLFFFISAEITIVIFLFRREQQRYEIYGAT
jgi:hypothetical protein